MHIFKTHHPLYRWSFFVLGIIATFSYRAIIVMNRYSLLWSDILWYIGTIGFGIYFIHRYQIDQSREDLIKQQKLVTKLSKQQTLSSSDRQALLSITQSLTSSTAKWNYLFIFLLSILALLYDLTIRLSSL